MTYEAVKSATGLSGALAIPPVPESVGEVEAHCDATLTQVRALRDAVVAARGQGARPLLLIDEMDAALDAWVPWMGLMANVHPDAAVRDAADACERKIMALVTEISLDKAVYEALRSTDTALLDEPAARSLRHHLRDFERSGVDKDEATRKRLAALQDRMVATGQEFAKAIREDVRSFSFTETQMAGLPGDFLDAHRNADGTYTVTTDYPDFFPVETYADDEAVRKQLYVAFLQRAWPENEKRLQQLLADRDEYASLLGYASWADYAAQDEMAKNARTIAEFIDKIAALARPRAQRDLEEMTARKRAERGPEARIEVWDRFYYANRIKQERFGVDAQKLRAYFPYRQVVAGLLQVTERLFGLRIEADPRAVAWSDEVVMYRVFDADALVGAFFLDMHPRQGKYKHAAMFPIVTGQAGKRLPVAALVCNFPRPTRDDAALMEHGDVVTLFHEFGHLLHHILGGGQAWVNLSGISVEDEFVEVPSQLYEEWAYDAQVLAGFARHVETGEPIPAELVKRLRQARDFGLGVHVMRQMFYAAMSLQFHMGPVTDLLARTKQLQERYSPYPYVPDTYVYANFGHLVGYGSAYYGYMWSLALAKDLLTRFAQGGLMDPATAAAYRRTVLAPGGSRDADDMVRDFLGRPFSFDAMKDYLEN